MDLIKKIKNYTYNQRHCLGQGSFGRVFEGKADDGHKVAVKKVQQRVVSNDSYLRSALQSEINIMKKLNHPNIVYLQDVVLTANSIYLIMEYCSGGDLKRYCRNKKVTEEQATEIIKQIVKGFQEIAKHGIIHRDLKPANILVHQGMFKICDFGFAKYFGQAKMAKTCVGTPIYMSPQVLSKKPYTDKTDVWSLGILFFQLVFNKLPFTGASEEGLITKIMENPKAPLSVASQSSKLVQNVLKGTLQVDQKNRWNWAQVFEAFQLVSIQNTQNKQTNRTEQVKAPENLFYKKSSQEILTVQEPEQKKESTSLPNMFRNLFNNFSGRKEKRSRDKNQESSQQKEKSERVNKPKPRNLLAFHHLNEQEKKNPKQNGNTNTNNNNNTNMNYNTNTIENMKTPPKANNYVEQENIRFLYFILVEFIVFLSQINLSPSSALPLWLPSFKIFLNSLYKHVLVSYDRKIRVYQQDNDTIEYSKVILSELEQLKNLAEQIPKTKQQGDPKKLAQIVLTELSKAQNEIKVNYIKGWIQRYIQRKYSYMPVAVEIK